MKAYIYLTFPPQSPFGFNFTTTGYKIYKLYTFFCGMEQFKCFLNLPRFTQYNWLGLGTNFYVYCFFAVGILYSFPDLNVSSAFFSVNPHFLYIDWFIQFFRNFLKLVVGVGLLLVSILITHLEYENSHLCFLNFWVFSILTCCLPRMFYFVHWGILF